MFSNIFENKNVFKYVCKNDFAEILKECFCKYEGINSNMRSYSSKYLRISNKSLKNKDKEIIQRIKFRKL